MNRSRLDLAWVVLGVLLVFAELAWTWVIRVAGDACGSPCEPGTIDASNALSLAAALAAVSLAVTGVKRARGGGVWLVASLGLFAASAMVAIV